MQSSILPFEIKGDSAGYVISKDYNLKNTYVLTISKSVSAETPFILDFKPGAEPFELNLNIVLEKNVTATLIEMWPEAFSAFGYKLNVSIVGNDYSHLSHLILNVASGQSVGTEGRRTELMDGARCDLYAYYFGAKQIDLTLNQVASGVGAKLYSDIITRCQNTQVFNFDCEHAYVGKDGEGDMLMKAVALDKGMVNLEGMVKIGQTGGGSAGFLQQETLNLSELTTVKATPGLKIDTNDVKAGHGSSIRNLNDEDLYYFAARGIEASLAKTLLIKSFLGGNLDKLSAHSAFVEAVESAIEIN